MKNRSWIILKCLFLAIILNGLISCEKEGDRLPVPVVHYNPDRSVLIYMAGHNSLSDFCGENMDSIISGMSNIHSSANILIYVNNNTDNPTLWKVAGDSDGNVLKEKIKEYEMHNSVDPAIMQQIIQETFSLYPAKEKGLILWSHATGWLPSPNYQKVNRRKRSFGEHRIDGTRNSAYLELWDLREVLEETMVDFDFIFFDACYMGAVEVVYELKDLADYLLVSPTEVMGLGFPYQNIVPLLCRDKLDYQAIAQSYSDYYDGSLRYAGVAGYFNGEGSISLVKTDKIEELATCYRTIRSEFNDRFSSVNSAEIQQLGRPSYRNLFFDFQNLIQAATPERLNDFNEKLNQVVVFKGNTPRFIEIEIRQNGGLTLFLPEANPSEKNRDAYTHLRWYDAIH